jgi:hypothetical protein
LRALLAGGLQMGLAFTFAVGPHLIKNGVLFDNPLAPFAGGSLGWADQVWFTPETSRRIVLTYPLALTFGNYWAQYGNLSPLLLAFSPLALLLARPRSVLDSALLAVTLAALLGVVTWLIVRPAVFSPRYILATLLLFALLPARAAEEVSQREARPRWLTTSVMGATSVTLVATGLFFANVVFFPRLTLDYLNDRVPECGRDGQHCRSMVLINEDSQPGDRVFLASWHRYWLRGDLLQCLSADEFNGGISGDTPEARWQVLYQQGFRYLLADYSTHAGILESLNLAALPAWVKAELIFEEEPIAVYRLSYTNPPVMQTAICRRTSPGPVWEVVAP